MAKRKDWSVAAMNKAVIDELCSGRRFLEELKRKDQYEEQLAAREAHAMRGNKGKTLKQAGSIPASDYWKIEQAQGKGCWDDRSFVRDYFKKFPHLKSAEL